MLPADAGSSVRASSKAPAGNSPREHRTALPAAGEVLGRASSRAPWPAKQRSAQPAFIRIGEDKDKGKPRTSHTQTHTAPALGHPGNSRPGLSTAAQTGSLPGISRMSQQGAAVAASATAPAAALLTPQSVTSSFSHNATAAPAPQAADLAVDCTAKPHQSSDAHQHDRAEHPVMPPTAVSAQMAVPIERVLPDVPASAVSTAAAAAAATAASAAQMCVTVPDAAAQQLDRELDRDRAAVRSAAVGSAALDSAALGSGAIGSSGILGSADTVRSAAAETLTALGSAVTLSLQQSSADAAASAPRAVLPTSRKKRKGPKATSKPQEPVKACHSWQALLGPDDIGKPEEPATMLLAGTFFLKRSVPDIGFCST